MTLQSLTLTLLKLRLASKAEIDHAVAACGGQPTAAKLLEFLELHSILTSYQTLKLGKGDSEGLVLGRFKLLYQNAAGSFARVYRAADMSSGEMVGLKLLRARHAKDPASVQQFRREAELGKSLDHPNIVPIYEVGETAGQYYFTMEFVEGGNLLELMRIRKKMSPREAVKCLLDISAGLDYAHRRGLMHRDLKLSNILMGTNGVAKLVDFGLADTHRARETTGSDGTQRTLDYATLEKHTNAPRDDPRSDLFFLGTIFFELLAGQPPLPRTKDRDVRGDFARYREIRPLHQVDPTLPRACCEIVDRLLDLNPNNRYQTTSELLADLKLAEREVNKPPHAGDMAAAVDHSVDPRAEVAVATEAASPAPSIPAPAQAKSSSRTDHPILLCLESRVKQQDMLRQYFTKHRFRVLVLGDISRAIARLEQTPVAGVIVVAEGFGDDAVTAFPKFQRACDQDGRGAVLVLAVKQAGLRSQVVETPHSAVVQQPATLRDIRKRLKELRSTQTESAAVEDAADTDDD
jgi:eukaryotic-like serine/threonine-protein kinase